MRAHDTLPYTGRLTVHPRKQDRLHRQYQLLACFRTSVEGRGRQARGRLGRRHSGHRRPRRIHLEPVHALAPQSECSRVRGPFSSLYRCCFARALKFPPVNPEPRSSRNSVESSSKRHPLSTCKMRNVRELHRGCLIESSPRRKAHRHRHDQDLLSSHGQSRHGQPRTRCDLFHRAATARRE